MIRLSTRAKKNRRKAKRSGLPTLRVEVDAPTHRLLTAEAVGPEEGQALLEQRLRERFVATLALDGLKVSLDQVQMATYELTPRQRALELERHAKWGTPGFQTATINDFMGWASVPYVLVGTAFFVHGRNINALDEQQLGHFVEHHMGPALSRLPRGSEIVVVEVEPNRLDALTEGVA